MPIEAYQIGIDLVANESRVTGPLRAMIEAMQRVQAATRETQTSINDMVSSLRGAGRVAATLASSMERVAKAAQAAARAGSAAGGSSGTARAEAAAGRAERAVAAAQVSAVPPALLTYSSQSRALAPYVPNETQGRLSGPAYTPYGGYTAGRPMSLAAPGSALAAAGGGAGGTGGNGTTAGSAANNPQGGMMPLQAPPVTQIPLNYQPPGFKLPPLPAGLSRANRMHMSMVAGAEAYEGFEVLKNIFEATAEPGDIIEKMRATPGFRGDEKRIEEAKALALAIQRKTPGMGYSSALDLINQTTSFTGDAGEAMALSPGLARNAQVLAQYGKGDAIAQVEKGIQAGELTGLTNKDGTMNIPKLSEFVTRLTSTVVSGGGTLNIGKYLTGIRQFGIGADSATMDFTTAVLPAYMKIMGEAKAGTALSSLQQSLGSTAPRTQNKSITAEQKRLGLRDAKGELVNGELLRTDANAYISTQLLPKIGADLTRQRLEITPAAIQGELTKILPRQTMIRLAAAGIFDAAVITKEANRNREQQAAQIDAERAGKAGPLDTLLASSPSNQVKGTVEAFKTFEAALGEPAMKSATQILNGITDGLLKMAGWAREHPDITEAALKGLAGGLIVLGSGAALAALTLLGGPTSLLAGVGAGAAAAATGMEKLDAALHKFLPGVFGPQTATPGNVYDPARDGPVYDPSTHGLASKLWNDPGGTLFGFEGRHLESAPTVQKQSYAPPPPANRPLHIENIMYLDGKVVHRSVMDWEERRQSRDPSGITGFDGRQTMTPPGMITA